MNLTSSRLSHGTWVKNGLHQELTYISTLSCVIELMERCCKPLRILKIWEAFFKPCYQQLVLSS